MDKLAKFLRLLVEAKRLKNKSFSHFKKNLIELDEKGIEQFRSLIISAEWFDKIKVIRDDFIEHHPSMSASIVFYGEKAHATLATTKALATIKNGEKEFKTISIEEIGDILTKWKELLKSLDNFLYKNICFPIKL